MAQTRKLIVGLGNPGHKYERTRHNLGFCVIQILARKWAMSLKSSESSKGLIARKSLEFGVVSLLMPLTYMNHSGVAVQSLIRREGYCPSDVLVICDDLNLPFGRLRLRPRGSSGGHNGLSSVIEHIQTHDFPRLRLGIGHPGLKADVVDYVLEKFSSSECAEMDPFLEKAAACCVFWAEEGLDKAMELFNQAPRDDEQSL